MKEEKTTSKKKLLYYLILGISVLLLAAATVLTVYFVTEGRNSTLEKPPVVEPEEPDNPSGGDDTVKFVAPLEYESLSTKYDDIYTSATTGFIYRHKAVDIAANEGDEVCSMADGTVKEISLSEETGNYISVDHGDGLVTLYRFVEPVDGLKVGAKVKKGETIATVAAAYGSEYKDGTHLHLEIALKGVPVDPLDYLEPVSEEK